MLVLQPVAAALPVASPDIAACTQQVEGVCVAGCSHCCCPCCCFDGAGLPDA